MRIKEEEEHDHNHNHLFFGGKDVVELVEKYGTPLYVTDERKLRENFRGYKDAFSDVAVDIDIYYAVKANGNLAILKILAEEGAGADVFSSGELYMARLAGIPAEMILFNGNSKSEDELREAMESNIKISVDSLDELRTLAGMVKEKSKGEEVKIAIRVNPDISPKVHPKIATGLKTSKFGIPYHQVIPACKEAEELHNVNLKGIHCHIGSQILDVNVFGEAIKKMMDIVEELYREGIELEFIDLGGGLGIGYKKDEKERAPTPKDLAKVIIPLFNHRKKRLSCINENELKLILEPGRSIVGSTTILLSGVNAVKRGYKNFVAIDAGFNLLIRPVMYNAYHAVVVANKMNEEHSELYTIVGPICEAGDIIADERKLPKVKKGDLIAILDTGAYGFAMSSQYNGRARCAEVLVNEGKEELIRQRENIGDLIRHQHIPARLL
jgi:diaminopimelate decarboxylase